MKLPYTIAMLVLLIAVGSYVVLFERKPVEPKKQVQEKILTFEATQLERLTLSYSDKKLVIQPDKDKKWKMVEPEDALLDQDKITRNIDKLKDWESLQVVRDDYKVNEAKTFGLDKPYLTLNVKLKGEQPKEFLVGSKTALNSGYYILPKGSTKLYTSYTYIPDDLVRLVAEPPKPTPSPSPSVSGTPASLPVAPATSSSPNKP